MTIPTMKIPIFKEENTMNNNTASDSKMENTTTGAKRKKIKRLKNAGKTALGIIGAVLSAGAAKYGKDIYDNSGKTDFQKWRDRKK